MATTLFANLRRSLMELKGWQPVLKNILHKKRDFALFVELTIGS